MQLQLQLQPQPIIFTFLAYHHSYFTAKNSGHHLLQVTLLHPTDIQQTHKTSKHTCAAAAFDTARYTNELYLSAPRKPSSSPHQNHPQTKKQNPNQNWSLIRFETKSRKKEERKQESYTHLMNSESKLDTLNYKLFFLRAATDHFKLPRHPLHVLHR